MGSWSWQKWVGKIAPLVTGALATGVWAFLELPAPQWAGLAAGLITAVVQGIISLFPPKV